MSLRKIKSWLEKYKYELLFIGLVQHLFIGIFISDLNFYANKIWAVNMFVLAITSSGVFFGKGKFEVLLKDIAMVLVLILPVLYPFFKSDINFLTIVSITYCLFFVFIFYEVLHFLIKPNYINKDVITASACGFLLLLEISVFLIQFICLHNPNSFTGIELNRSASSFIDIVYYCSITLTTIGYGDISPNTYSAKLVISIIGWASQFYSVLLVGILVGKFSSIIGEKKK